MTANRLLLVCTFLALPTVAAGQDGSFARIAPATLREIEPILDAAERDSLPLATLEAKVLEGVAKQVAPGQIGRVVGALADELRVARTVLRELLPGRRIADGEVVAAALATRQGVAPEVLRALWDASPDGGSLEIAVTVLGELVRRGVPAGDASAVMANVVRSAVPLHVAAQIPGKVDGGLISGATPTAALETALRVLNIPGLGQGQGQGRGRGPNR